MPRAAFRENKTVEVQVGASTDELPQRARLEPLSHSRNASARNAPHVVPVRCLVDGRELRVVADLQCNEYGRRDNTHEVCHCHGTAIWETLTDQTSRCRDIPFDTPIALQAAVR